MSLSIAVVSILLTFVCTGVLANWLVQRWQYRNWINQQRFLGSEKRYEALNAHANEISKIAATRLSAMFRLVLALDQSGDILEERRKAYSEAVDLWNQNINSFFFKTTMYFNWHMTKRLEDEIHNRFVTTGATLEKAVRLRQGNADQYAQPRTPVLANLNAIQGSLVNFNRDMLRHVLKQYASTYHGVELRYTKEDLGYFSTWQLFKALFMSRVEEFGVTLTAFELERPARRGN